MKTLDGKVAVVTGASRGVGRGVALALGDAGATVYVTGRTTEGERSVGATAEEVSRRGGVGVAARCDHADDEQTRAVFERVRSEHGGLDVLVNNVFAIPKEKFWGTPFWEQPIALWDTMHTVGLRSHYVASVFAAPLLIERGGLIVNVSSFGGAGYQLNVAYGVGKAGVDRLSADMAHELRSHGVACVSLYPGIVRTEYILEHAAHLPFSLEASESPELSGRAVAALAADPRVLEQTGTVQVVAELAARYGFEDVDGAVPPSLRSPREESR